MILIMGHIFLTQIKDELVQEDLVKKYRKSQACLMVEQELLAMNWPSLRDEENLANMILWRFRSELRDIVRRAVTLPF
jgi:hypothetical protein